MWRRPRVTESPIASRFWVIFTNIPTTFSSGQLLNRDKSMSIKTTWKNPWGRSQVVRFRVRDICLQTTLWKNNRPQQGLFRQKTHSQARYWWVCTIILKTRLSYYYMLVGRVIINYVWLDNFFVAWDPVLTWINYFKLQQFNFTYINLLPTPH